MRKINCIFVPNIGTNDTVLGYTVIRFPGVEKELEELMNIKNAEIICKIDTREDLLRDIQDKFRFKVEITEERFAPSFDIALSWFDRMTRAG